MGRVIVLNGTSSAGKTSLGLALQRGLDGDWHVLGIDTFLGTCPERWLHDGTFRMADGVVEISDRFRAHHRRWVRGVAAMATAGADLIIDEVFLDGAATESVWREALAATPIVSVKVHCPLDVAVTRERQRGDRMLGMAVEQAERVHAGVTYDLEVDTSSGTPDELAARLMPQVVALLR